MPPPVDVAVSAAQEQQRGLSVLLMGSMARAWGLLDVQDLPGTYPQYEQAVRALVHKFGQASAALAATFYGTARAEHVPGRFRVIPVGTAPAEQVARSLGWATRSLRTATPDPQAAHTLSAGVAQKMTLDAGRNTLIGAIQADKRCRGWYRVARADACSFCLMNAIRGPVYKDRGTADFKAHDHDACIPAPLFADKWEPSADIRRWQAVYRESTSGLRGGAARNAFRQAVEGRQI